VSQVRARFHPDFHEMVLVLMYRGLSASDKHNMRQNIHDYVHVQGAELPRRQRDPNINYHSQTHAKVDIRQTAQWPKHQQSKLISARKHTGPSINGTLATANTANHDITKRTVGVYGSF
jgi:hypothetical protein